MSGSGVIERNDMPALPLVIKDEPVMPTDKDFNEKSGNSTPLSRLEVTQRTASNSVVSGYMAKRALNNQSQAESKNLRKSHEVTFNPEVRASS